MGSPTDWEFEEPNEDCLYVGSLMGVVCSRCDLAQRLVTRRGAVMHPPMAKVLGA